MLSLAAIAVTLTVYATWLGACTGILLFVGKEVNAKVVSYTQPAGGNDWILNYEFRTEKGQVNQGTARFAPKDRLPDDSATIHVKYLKACPSISAVVGYISVTGLVAYLFSLYIGYRAFVLWRLEKAKRHSSRQL